MSGELAELRFALDALEDAADKIRAAIAKIETEGEPPADASTADEILLYGAQSQILYRAIRLRPLSFAVEWPLGIAGSGVFALEVRPL